MTIMVVRSKKAESAKNSSSEAAFCHSHQGEDEVCRTELIKNGLESTELISLQKLTF
jgi:hypothetical protein